jgi:predicted nucleotidyltransferase
MDPRLHRIVAMQPYPLLFATISGAHLYGFPSPDSDFDLRGAHVLPLRSVLGLDARHETVEASRVIDGLDMDVVSHDVKKFFGLLLKKNGYVLEQLFSPLVVHTTPEHEELKEICRSRISSTPVNSEAKGRRESATSPRPNGSPSPPQDGSPIRDERSALRGPPKVERVKNPAAGGSESLLTSAPTGVITKHHSHHYFGFAETQWKLFLKESPRRVKPLLYVYRVLLTGIHLMRSGEIEANLATLNEEFRLPYIADLVARKLAGPEKSKLEDADIAFHQAEYQRLRGELQAAHEASQLPEAPSEETRAALNDLLVRIRLAGKDGR